jgi:hypothetical protein
MSEAARVGLVSASVPNATGWGHAAPGTVRVSGEEAYVACADGWIALETVLVDDEVRPAASVLRDGERLAPLESSGQGA